MKPPSRTFCRCLCSLMVVGLLTACQPPSPGLGRLGEPTSLETAPPRIDSALPANSAQSETFLNLGTAARTVAPGRSAGGATQAGDVKLDFNDTDIREVARVILGTILKVNYTIDPKVQGAATLDIGTPLPRSALLPTLETLLNQNGATLVERNGLYQIVPIGAAAVTNTVRGEGDNAGTGTQVVYLRYAGATDLAKVLQPYVAAGSKVTADPARNAVIISGESAARQSLAALIQAFDVNALAGESFAVFPVKQGDAETQAAALEKALQMQEGGAAAGMIRIVPLPRTNVVLVASPQPSYLQAARRFFELTDRVEDATARTWHIYYIQNGQADDLANLLQRAFTPDHVTAPLPGSTAPGAQPQTMSSGGLFQESGFGGSASGSTPGVAGLGATPAPLGVSGSASPALPAPRPAPGAPPATEPLSAESAGGAEDQMRIIADHRNNALLIYATPGEYSVIDGMLHKIDIIPLQVLIEATIAEVTLNDQLSYGTQFFLGGRVNGTLSQAASGASNSIATIAGTPIGFAPNFPGFVLNNGAREVINALAAVTKVTVLSAPQVMVLDNEAARLQVGQQVPVLTGTATSTLTTGAPIVNSVDYHPTGVIMQVTPRVNSGGLVTLDIAQEVSDVAAAQTNTVSGSPTFDDQTFQTRVAVQDGQTVGLAGLIRDNDSQGNSGIPFLKDIPLLGSLMSGQQNTRQRTELLVLITPHVVHDQRDAYTLTEDLRQQLLNAALVKPELSRRPVPGSANPNGL
jgi:general secretion pathway protein D